MFDFHFVYSDNNVYDVKNVHKVIYLTSSSSTEVSGDEILSTKFPLKTTYLFTENGCVTVSGTNLMVIDVLKQ